MRSIFKGSFVLPFFFFCFYAFAESSLSDYFEVFYQKPEAYSVWLKNDKKDTFKDIFISLYDLPASKARKFSHAQKVEEIQGFSGKASYVYFYFEFESRTDAGLLFYGIKNGEVSVNGMKRGTISVLSDRGYSVLKGTYEKGIYFVSVKVTEKNDKTGIVVLSDKKLKNSEKRGFTKSAKSALSVKNFDNSDKSGTFSALFSTFCFPYFEDIADSREVFFEILGKNSDVEKKNPLILLLYSAKNDGKYSKTLKKLGFSDKNLSAWQENFLNKGVCNHE
ncbi:hypothetical protein J6Z19_06400 [bacterium]|nr:hypothetical protein [bacterium]